MRRRSEIAMLAWVAGACQAVDSSVPVADTLASSAETAAAVADPAAGPEVFSQEVADAAPEAAEDAAQPPPPSECFNSKPCQVNFPTKPYCAIGIKKCVQCLTEFNCNDGKACIDFACADIHCTPGEVSCDGPFLQTCNATGDGWIAEKCPSDSPVCADGKCRVCQPDKAYCAPPEAGQSKAIYMCASDGSFLAVKQTCDEGLSCHLDAKLQPHCMACIPGTRECQGNKAMVCQADGSAMTLDTDCAESFKTCAYGLCIDACETDFRVPMLGPCHHWAVDLDPVPPACLPDSASCTVGGSPWSVTVANDHGVAAFVTLNGADSAKFASYQVAAFGTLNIALPPPDWKLPDQSQLAAGVNDKAIRIGSSLQLQVTQNLPATNASDYSASVTTLATITSKAAEHVVVGWPRTQLQAAPAITVASAAAEPAKVTVLALGPGKQAAKDYNLDVGQVLHLPLAGSATDWTGTRIVSGRPVAVYFSSPVANVPLGEACVAGKCALAGWPCQTSLDCPQVCCGDHLSAQLLPVSSWATTYVAAHFAPRGKAKDIWRAVAGANALTLTTDPPQGPPVTLPPYGFHDFESAADFVIQGTAPFEVAQFMAGRLAPDANPDQCVGTLGMAQCAATAALATPQACQQSVDCPPVPQADDALIGDPDMVVTLPAALWPDHARFVCPEGFAAQFVTLVRLNKVAVQLDGKEVADSAFAPIAQGYSVARLPLATGEHWLVAPQSVYAVVHGWAQQKSYAFAPVKMP